MAQSPVRRAVSTWSLHRTLGGFTPANPAGASASHLGELRPPTLLELIPELAAREYQVLQICHFHLESREPAYLKAIRAELQKYEIELDMLLIDDGNLVAANIEPELEWYDSWLEAAHLLGAKRARLCAGRSEPTPELLDRSGKHLAQLAQKHPGVRIVTENWMELTPDAASVLAVLNSAGDDVGLLIDLANWHPPGKYDQLAQIAPEAESCHAKCVFTADGPDDEDFRRTLGILKEVGFNGPIALIYDGPDPDEWAGLDIEWGIVQEVFQ